MFRPVGHLQGYRLVRYEDTQHHHVPWDWLMGRNVLKSLNQKFMYFYQVCLFSCIYGKIGVDNKLLFIPSDLMRNPS
jgi:hypothetical protein